MTIKRMEQSYGHQGKRLPTSQKQILFHKKKVQIS